MINCFVSNQHENDGHDGQYPLTTRITVESFWDYLNPEGVVQEIQDSTKDCF